MKRWFKFVWKYPNGADVHHNVWIAWNACTSLLMLSFMERPNASAVECKFLWWFGLLALINGILITIHYEFFVKPDYWKPEDKEK